MDNNTKYSQEELLTGIVKNDIQIINHIYNNNFRSIRYLIIQNSGGEQDAEDVFQEAMVVLFRRLQGKDFKLTSSLNTFLYSIARLIWLKELNRRKKGPEIIDTEELSINTEDNTIDLIERNERLRLYREKFEELSDDCKKVLRFFLNNIPIKDITAKMGYSSVQHTKNRRFRCKKTLINKIRNSSKFKELGNENSSNDRGIPRW